MRKVFKKFFSHAFFLLKKFKKRIFFFPSLDGERRCARDPQPPTAAAGTEGQADRRPGERQDAAPT